MLSASPRHQDLGLPCSRLGTTSEICGLLFIFTAIDGDSHILNQLWIQVSGAKLPIDRSVLRAFKARHHGTNTISSTERQAKRVSVPVLPAGHIAVTIFAYSAAKSAIFFLVLGHREQASSAMRRDNRQNWEQGLKTYGPRRSSMDPSEVT